MDAYWCDSFLSGPQIKQCVVLLWQKLGIINVHILLREHRRYYIWINFYTFQKIDTVYPSSYILTYLTLAMRGQLMTLLLLGQYPRYKAGFNQNQRGAENVMAAFFPSKYEISTDVNLMLTQRRRRWINIKFTSVQPFVLVGFPVV